MTDRRSALDPASGFRREVEAQRVWSLSLPAICARIDGPDSKIAVPEASRTVTCSQARREGYPSGACAGEIADVDLEFERAPAADRLAIETAAVSRCTPDGGLRGDLEFLTRRDHPQRGAVPVQHAEHQKVAAEECVPGHRLARFAEDGCDRRVGNRGHVARLAAAFAAEGAVPPLEIRHLFRQRANRRSVRPDGLR